MLSIMQRTARSESGRLFVSADGMYYRTPDGRQVWVTNRWLDAVEVWDLEPDEGSLGVVDQDASAESSLDLATVTVRIYSGADVSGTLVDTLTASRDADTGAYAVSPTTDLAAGRYTAQLAKQTGETLTPVGKAQNFQVVPLPPIVK